jgi:RNA polymerase sigma-70 factor (sigma-E family)
MSNGRRSSSTATSSPYFSAESRKAYNLPVELGVWTHVIDLRAMGAGEDVPVTGADELAALYVVHYGALVRLAALLLDDTAACEDVVQEAYIRRAASRRLQRLRDPDAGLAYLRTTVLNLARSSLRRRLVATRYAPLVHRADHADDDAISAVERAAVVAAMRNLPRRMREAVALRYYADLTEAQTADVMGVSVGSVKSYTARGLERLAALLKVTE